MFNLKILFNSRGKVSVVERGNFPEKDSSLPVRRIDQIKEDSLVRWMVDPENTGVKGILTLLNLEPASNLKVLGFSDNEREINHAVYGPISC